jgi:methionyl-tRNA synthetase
MSEPFYITTAIAYPNGKPHIGHAYEAIATDAIARFQRMQGRDVRFVTGTDEHGLKMVQTARSAGRDTREFADEMSSYFKDMCAKLNISYDCFMRTTDARHHEASVAIWKAMEASGDLYLDRYEGWYSVRDEAFYDEKELSDGEGGEKLSPQGTPVEWTKEETWFFRLSKYERQLLELYELQPDFIRPESRRNEVMRFVEGGLKDLSVSRTSFDWGVKVPGSPDHVMYVWVDALTTYLSGIGYPDAGGDFARFWPANVHIIGKDIVRFHTVYWPAFLMSAGLPLPRQVFGHGFILARDGSKMGKSAGNASDPLELAERYGVDQLRYFLLREVSFGQDGTYSEEAIVTRCNAELANSFGNLAQRVLSFIAKNCESKIPVVDHETLMSDVDREFLAQIEMHLGQFLIEFRLLWIDRAIQEWMKAVYRANSYVDEQAPWALRKTDPDRMNEVLSVLCLAIHHLAKAMQPVIPVTSAKILDQLGVPEDQRNFPLNDNGLWHIWDASWAMKLKLGGVRLPTPSPTFPRLELPDVSNA